MLRSFHTFTYQLKGGIRFQGKGDLNGRFPREKQPTVPSVVVCDDSGGLQLLREAIFWESGCEYYVRRTSLISSNTSAQRTYADARKPWLQRATTPPYVSAVESSIPR